MHKCALNIEQKRLSKSESATANKSTWKTKSTKIDIAERQKILEKKTNEMRLKRRARRQALGLYKEKPLSAQFGGRTKDNNHDDSANGKGLIVESAIVQEQ